MAEKCVAADGVQHGLAGIAVVRPANAFGSFDDFNPETARVVPT
jgi:hypothetical protein